MTIYEFVESVNDSECIEYRVFDCCKEDVVFSGNIDEISDSEYADEEIGGTDIWYDPDRKLIVIEFNIEGDDEEDENFEMPWDYGKHFD